MFEDNGLSGNKKTAVTKSNAFGKGGEGDDDDDDFDDF